MAIQADRKTAVRRRQDGEPARSLPWMPRRSWIIAPIVGIAVLAALLAWLGPVEQWLFLLGIVLLLAVGFILHRPARVFFVFLALLPIYQLTGILLLHFTGSPALLRIYQPWKEGLAGGALVLTVAAQITLARRFRLSWLDRLALFYLGFTVVRLLLPSGVSMVARLYGLRSDAFLVVLYFLGRSVPLTTRRQRQILMGLLILGILTGIFALVDRLLLPIDWPMRIGLSDYLARGQTDPTAGAGAATGPLGLPWTFWTATRARRSSGFFANPLDLAASLHVTGVAALIGLLYFRRRTRGRWLAGMAFALLLVALGLSISRAATVIFALECLMIAYLTRRRRLILILLIGGALGLIILLLASPQMAGFVWDTVTFQNPSSRGHLLEWTQGLTAMFQHPLGLGLGTSGHVGALFGSQVGGENQYIILGVEMGFPGVLLYLLLELTAIRAGLRLFKRSTGITQVLALTAAISRVGLALAGITAHIEVYLFVAYINWWLLGFVSQTEARLARPISALAPGPLGSGVPAVV